MNSNKTNKKVAIIDHVGIKSGMNCYDLGLSSGLMKSGVETHLFSNFEESKANLAVYNYFDAEKKSSLRAISNFVNGHVRAYRKCKQLKIKTVIIHIFSTYYKEYIEYFLAKLFKLDVITIVHDINDFMDQDNDAIKNYIYKNSKTLIVHNQFSFEELSSLIDSTLHERISVIPHGNYIPFIEGNMSKKEARAQLGLEQDETYLLFFGQIKRVKGLDVLLKAMTNINTGKLIVAGKPRKDDFAFYENIIEENHLASKLKLDIRFITDEERDLYFRASDILILPYRRIYQSGVLLLAMSYGLPVIASNLPANIEVIQQYENGVLFEEGDVEDLQLKILELLDNSVLRNKIHKHSIQTVEEKHNWESIGGQYSKLI